MHRPRRALGQNFLVDPNIQRRIIETADVGGDDEVIEIGPGLGALTDRLAGTVAHLTAIELDRDLAARLRSRFAGRDDITIVEADFLDTSIADFTTDPGQVIVVGNIPYNITSQIVFHLLERGRRPARIILMVQREVADRITARAGSGEYGALSVGVQTVARAEALFNVSRNCFRPVPAVDSAVLRITPLRPPPLSATGEADLRSLTAAAFGWRRKQLQKTLRASPGYALDAGEVDRVAAETGLSLERRPETLTPEEFVSLSRALRSLGRPAGQP